MGRRGALAGIFFLASLASAPLACEPLGDRLEAAEAVYRSTGPEQALPLFTDLVRESEAAGDAAIQSRAIGFIGELYWRLGDFEQAADNLQRALHMKQAQGDRFEEGRTLNVMGLLAWDLGEFDAARTYLEEAAAIGEETGDARLAGSAWNNLGLIYDELGDYDASLAEYHKALKTYEQVDFPRGRGDTLGNIGGIQLLLGRYREALDQYQQALAISESLGSAIALSQDHGNLGLAYLGLGQVGSAIAHLDQAIALAEASGLRQDEAYWLGVMGGAQLLLGRYDRAVELRDRSLAIYRQLDAKTELIEALYDNGQLRYLLGDLGAARGFLTESMELARNLGVARGVTINLLALGDLQLRQNDTEAALALYAQAAERARESGELSQWLSSLLRLSEVHRMTGGLESAREEAGQALKIGRETGALGLEAAASYALGEVDRLAGQPSASQVRYAAALEGLAAAPDSELAWRVHYGWGLALADEGNLEAAIAALGDAIEVIEGVRDRLGQERFRAGYVQDKYQVYIDLVHLQLEASRVEDAFSTAERLRSRSYLDLLESQVSEESAGDAADEYALRERIRTLRRTLAEEQNRMRPERREAAIVVYSRELLAAERTYQAMLDDRSHRHTAARQSLPGYIEIRQALQSGEALLEYVVGDEQLVAFVLTAKGLFAHTVGLGRRNLDNKVELLRSLIRQQDSELWRKPAASLAQALIWPMLDSSELEAVEQLYLVPHGTLNYLPFAVLPLDDERAMVERFTLAYLPSATALTAPRQAAHKATGLLAMAPARSRLVYAQAEAQVVDELFDPESKALLGPAATESAFKREAGDYGMLHLATHGYFNQLNPMLSGLELEADQANDGQLELHEILGLQLDAVLVTLSACQTGLGSGFFATVPAGDDFVGLTRAFLFAGSSSVLATLWEVDDASTLDLMTSFYGALRQSKGAGDPSASLARAQRAMLADGRYGHPYYWAPFVLVGGITAKG